MDTTTNTSTTPDIPTSTTPDTPTGTTSDTGAEKPTRSGPSNDTVARYEAANRPLSAVLDAAVPDAWDRPSPCDGWAARDVVRHLVETQREFLGRHDLDLGDAPDVDADPAAAWREHTRRVVEVLGDPSIPDRAFDGHFGPTTIGVTLGQFYVWDMIVHRWDVATAVGADAAFTNTELDAVDAGADSFGEALHMDGICRPAVEVPADADRTTRLLARLGRRR